MTTELWYLALSALLAACLWLPYILAQLILDGPRMLTYPGDLKPLPNWAARASRAHANAIENLIPMAALVLIAHAAGISNEMTTWGAAIFFWARLAHPIGYISGLPLARTVPFAAGWIATLMVFWGIFTS